MNNTTHVFVEPEPSPGNSQSHRQRLDNNHVQIRQPALHGGALSGSKSQQQQQQQLSLPAAHQHQTYNTPLQGQITTAATREAEPGNSQNSKNTAVPNKTKTKKNSKDQAKEVKALKARIAEMESKEKSDNREKMRKMERNVFVKVEDSHPDSGTSAPGPSSAQAYALDDVETDSLTEDDLQSLNEISVTFRSKGNDTSFTTEAQIQKQKIS